MRLLRRTAAGWKCQMILRAHVAAYALLFLIGSPLWSSSETQPGLRVLASPARAATESGVVLVVIMGEL